MCVLCRTHSAYIHAYIHTADHSLPYPLTEDILQKALQDLPVGARLVCMCVICDIFMYV